ncbi:MAG: reverse transcriptase domain-containing protein, partial [bacterium]
RLVCRGFNIIPGVDYEDTFSPMAKMVFFCIFLTFFAIYCLETASLDVKTAFLNAKMEKEVVMLPPPNLKELMRKPLWDPSISFEDTQEISRQLKL